MDGRVDNPNGGLKLFPDLSLEKTPRDVSAPVEDVAAIGVWMRSFFKIPRVD